VKADPGLTDVLGDELAVDLIAILEIRSFHRHVSCSGYGPVTGSGR
jgi:hypothetical protein